MMRERSTPLTTSAIGEVTAIKSIGFLQNYVLSFLHGPGVFLFFIGQSGLILISDHIKYFQMDNTSVTNRAMFPIKVVGQVPTLGYREISMNGRLIMPAIILPRPAFKKMIPGNPIQRSFRQSRPGKLVKSWGPDHDLGTILLFYFSKTP